MPFFSIYKFKLSFEDSDEDDTFSVCSTETDCTAHSWDLEYSTSADATNMHIPDARKEDVAQEPSKFNHEFSEGMKCTQERATKIDLSLSQFDRSFSLPKCKPAATEDTELRDPTEQYASFQHAEVHKLLVRLKSLHLDQYPQASLCSQSTIVAAPPALPLAQYNTLQEFSRSGRLEPAAVSKSVASQNTKDQAASIIANPPTVSKQSYAESTRLSTPISSSMKRGREVSESASLEQIEDRPKKILRQPKAHHNDPFSTIRENLYLVPSEYHILIEKMLSECEGHKLETCTFPRNEDRPNFEELSHALVDEDAYRFNFVGQQFGFQELHSGTISKWYKVLFAKATLDEKDDYVEDEDEFRAFLRTLFMTGLHPKDCLPKNSDWVEYFFDDTEILLNNKRIDDIYAWRFLECNMDEPPCVDPPWNADVELVEAFRVGSSLDILQKVIVDWLDVDDEELQKQRADRFEDAMDEAHLCDSGANQRREAFFRWLKGCEMSFADTLNNPERKKGRAALEEALFTLITYRYPRSWFLGSNEPLSQAKNDDQDNELDECDNRVPGRG